MSYYNGIPDKDLREEGWTDQQISELRKLEDNIRTKRKKEYEEEQARWRKEWEALGPWGQKAFSQLWMCGTPKEMVYEAAKRKGEIMEREHIARQVRIANRKWYQFWVK